MAGAAQAHESRAVACATREGWGGDCTSRCGAVQESGGATGGRCRPSVLHHERPRWTRVTAPPPSPPHLPPLPLPPQLRKLRTRHAWQGAAREESRANELCEAPRHAGWRVPQKERVHLSTVHGEDGGRMEAGRGALRDCGRDQDGGGTRRAATDLGRGALARGRCCCGRSTLFIDIIYISIIIRRWI